MYREHIKNLIRERLIREGEKEIPELREISKIVYRSFIDVVHERVMNIQKELEEKNVSPEYIIKRYIMAFEKMDITDKVLNELEPGSFDKLNEFIRAIHSSRMNFKFVDIGESGLDGEYGSETRSWDEKNSKELIVFHDVKTISKKIFNSINDLSATKQEHVIHMNIKDVLSEYRKRVLRILVHELQHAYDDYRSGGEVWDEEDNIIASKIKKLAKDIGPDDEIDEETSKRLHDLYLSMPHEVWARFAEVISAMEDDGIFDDTSDFKIVFNRFKDLMEGFDVLSDRMKKRVIKTLYKFWKERN